MKRIWISFLVVCMVTFGITGCGTGRVGVSETTENAATEETKAGTIKLEVTDTANIKEEVTDHPEGMSYRENAGDEAITPEQPRVPITTKKEWNTLLKSTAESELQIQSETNDTTWKLYELWDNALNDVWNVLKHTLSKEDMKALVIKEREWIAARDEAMEKVRKEYEDAQMQSMAVNVKGAALTKERVYELQELLK